MTKKPIEEASLLEVAVSRVGFRRAITALTFLLTWGFYVDATPDEEHTVARYAEFANMSDREAFRKASIFREAFPDQANASAMWERVRGAVGDGDRQEVAVARVGAVRLA